MATSGLFWHSPSDLRHGLPQATGAATACPTGCHRPWRCPGTCHRYTQGMCRGTCHVISRQYRGTCDGNSHGVQCHGMPWQPTASHGIAVGCNGKPWHVKSNGFPAAQGNMRAVRCSTMLVLYIVLCWKLNDDLHASCNPPRISNPLEHCCGVPLT